MIFVIIKTEGLSKLFRTDEIETTALDAIDLTVEKGEFTSIPYDVTKTGPRTQRDK